MKKVIYLADNGFKIKRGGVLYSEENKKTIPFDAVKDASEIEGMLKLKYIKKLEIDESDKPLSEKSVSGKNKPTPPEEVKA
jgi:hypothetical protein